MKSLLRFEDERNGTYPSQRIKELAQVDGFKVYASLSIPSGDCWLFWVEHEKEIEFKLPLVLVEYGEPEEFGLEEILLPFENA